MEVGVTGKVAGRFGPSGVSCGSAPVKEVKVTESLPLCLPKQHIALEKEKAEPNSSAFIGTRIVL